MPVHLERRLKHNLSLVVVDEALGVVYCAEGDGVTVDRAFREFLGKTAKTGDDLSIVGSLGNFQVGRIEGGVLGKGHLVFVHPNTELVLFSELIPLPIKKLEELTAC